MYSYSTREVPRNRGVYNEISVTLRTSRLLILEGKPVQKLVTAIICVFAVLRRVDFSLVTDVPGRDYTDIFIICTFYTLKPI
jgi:hypothetical protein